MNTIEKAAWTLVPVEPTDEMRKAGIFVAGYNDTAARPEDIYTAMLQAAPEPPAASVAVDDSQADGWEWAIVEIFGHRKHAGRTREEERFGAKLIRIDVPLKGDPAANGWSTHYYGGASIFSFTPTDETVVMRLNKPYDAPSRYALADHTADDGEGDF